MICHFAHIQPHIFNFSIHKCIFFNDLLVHGTPTYYLKLFLTLKGMLKSIVGSLIHYNRTSVN